MLDVTSLVLDDGPELSSKGVQIIVPVDSKPKQKYYLHEVNISINIEC